MTIKAVKVTIEHTGNAKPQVISLVNTQEAKKNNSGKMVKSIWQPKPGTGFIADYSKLYVDTTFKTKS